MYNLIVNDYDRRVYREELRDFLPPRFIDLHTHVWLDEFADYGGHHGGASWTRTMATDMTTEQLLETYRVLFPENEVTPLIFGGCLKNIGQCNTYVEETAKKYNLPALFRTDYIMTAEEVENGVKAGGFLGIKPYLSNVPPYLPDAEIRIFDFLPHHHLEVCDRNGWIVMLHIPRKLRLRDPVNIAQLMEIEEKYPNLKLVVAHIGRAYSKQDVGDAFETLGKTKNMLFEFTANVCDDAIKACIEAVGPKRFMFGTDLPIAIMRMYRITDETGRYYNVIPRGIYGDVSHESSLKETDETDITLMVYEQLRAFKRVAEELKFSRDDVEDILYRNAKTLLGL